MKIFQIGFNKCATRALSYMFKENGYLRADWEQGRLAQSIAKAMESGQKPLSDYPDVTIFSDMEYVKAGRPILEGYRQFEYIDRHYPEALFILNTRSCEAWLRSRCNHGNGVYLENYRRHYGYDTPEEVIDRWRREWHRHHLDVLGYFSDSRRHRLFVLDIDKPDFEAFQKFLEVDLDISHWTKRGVSKAPSARK